MPLLTDVSDTTPRLDPDAILRAVVTFGVALAQIDPFELAPHRHAKSQLLLTWRGALSVEIERGLWMVPPGSAIWIPGGALHAIRVTGAMEGYGAFIDPAASTRLPAQCRAIGVTPLLRELLMRTARMEMLYEADGPEARLAAVLIDEIAAARVEDLHLPMPHDTRLRRVVERIMAAPARREPVEAIARDAGLSERTLARLMVRETGMSLVRWRQQLAVMLAVRAFASGRTIQQVSEELGYDSVPSFVTMFRKVLGAAPGRYMAERHG